MIVVLLFIWLYKCLASLSWLLFLFPVPSVVHLSYCRRFSIKLALCCSVVVQLLHARLKYVILYFDFSFLFKLIVVIEKDHRLLENLLGKIKWLVI